ncbi:hypothetical protein CesoFtcFv8_014304 [Champsocephalus esox]|uniref:Uncharacterized protein n=1 Tax=Champsocephalus esox TaxID=159716 RepID=A0AAN8BS94_9TELE|nr:hypothetical protein CesoFtcFv8_014304 [Champsocephalus esox]
MMGPGCRPHHVDVVLLRTAWLQDSWLSHWTLKRTHPHFLSLSPEAELGSALSAVITERPLPGTSEGHRCRWRRGSPVVQPLTWCCALWDSGIHDQKVLAAVVEGRYESMMELVSFQRLSAHRVQLGSHTSSPADTHITSCMLWLHLIGGKG